MLVALHRQVHILPLSAEESSRFEDLSKVYFEDFYAAPYVLRPGGKGVPEPPSRSDQVFEFEDDPSKRDLRTPTDEDLAELLADVSKEGGQLDQLTCGGVCPPTELEPLPLVNNVSLSEGIVFTPQNVSEMSMMQEQRQAALATVMAPPAPATLYNETTMPGLWVQQAELAPNDSEFLTFVDIELSDVGSGVDTL
ncbi:hypothetical protein OESDEN_17248 [Oesophagostomum dentatum]|uniref:Uncharacterized protein n=1 Tax=Oesophagostomum dentatum TaxID=61180 RepID=A0A0B1SGP2_OESDE|nr:hypothetical protein OESDEN_17248 [Oesophagostomum dentatum]